MPLTYNFYPELLETLPWGSGQQAAGLKAVHLHSRWHPLASVGDSRIAKFFQEEAVRQYPLVEEWSPHSRIIDRKPVILPNKTSPRRATANTNDSSEEK